MAKDFSKMEHSNRSSNLSIHQVSDPAKRQTLHLAAWLGLLGSLSPLSAQAKPSRMGFKAMPIGVGDYIELPTDYVAMVLAPWGEPVGIAGNMPAYKPDASNTAQEQSVQMGMHHDGLVFFPLQGSSTHGLLVNNHEYVDEGLLFPDGFEPMTAEKVLKAQNAHGISVIEVRLGPKGWQMVRPSTFARRITANTPMTLSGPAAGHALMRTAADNKGVQVLGTLNNCASSMTPWGTYLSGEENWAFYFAAGDKPSAHHKRWGLRSKSNSQWEAHDARFNAELHPNEPNRFGWIVEVDPMDPSSTPIKRTALGRGAHEGAWVAQTKAGHAVVYSGEDARFEYIYKFVSRDKIQAGGAAANRVLLDHGTLYVARFDANGTGVWLPLVHGQGPLTAAHGFADQGEVLIKARQASDALGATKMDRPEWLTIDPASGWVYCTLTNNSQRGEPGKPGVDAANPRANNTMGQIIRWLDAGDFDGLQFTWNHLLLAGDPANARPEAKGNIQGDVFGCPDGITFGPGGLLWIQTDVHSSQLQQGEFERMGNNQLLACDVSTGEVRRFFTGPANCEVTGLSFTPDGTTMFLNIQHPGESPSDRSDPKEPPKYSSWPDYVDEARPRSASVAVRKKNGGVIGL
jgi:secreted PhoX family phosphatase